MKTSKPFIYILTAIVIVGGLTFFLASGGNKESSSDSSLAVEKSISHGHGLAVDVQDSNKVYIATHYGLFVLLNDSDLYRIGNSRDDYMGFSTHPTEANTFFSSGHPSRGGNIGFQKSEDGGVSWNKVSNGVNGPADFHALAVSPVNPDLIYGWYHGNLQRSLNQGETWEIVNKEIMPAFLVADTQDENLVYAATPQGQGVLVSRDKGVTWTTLSPLLEGGAVTVISVHPKNNQIMLAFSEKLGGLVKSIDNGRTWAKVSENFNGDTILHIAFSRSNPDIVYALGHTNTIFKSTDGGDSWTKIR